MQSNKQFAAFNHVPAELSPEIEPFAMFSLNLGDCMENGKHVCPSMVGKNVELWAIETILPSYEVAKARARAAQQEEEGQKEAKRQANLRKYIKQGFAFDHNAKSNPDGIASEDSGESDKVDDWANFFADNYDSRGKSKGNRRGHGVHNNGAFDSLVDSAQ